MRDAPAANCVKHVADEALRKTVQWCSSEVPVAPGGVGESGVLRARVTDSDHPVEVGERVGVDTQWRLGHVRAVVRGVAVLADVDGEVGPLSSSAA